MKSITLMFSFTYLSAFFFSVFFKVLVLSHHLEGLPLRTFYADENGRKALAQNLDMRYEHTHHVTPPPPWIGVHRIRRGLPHLLPFKWFVRILQNIT